MANYRGSGSDSFSIGAAPPEVSWTVVKGDTAAFRVYVTDENRDPLTIADWDIAMDIVREGTTSDTVIVSLTPGVTADDDDGEFTVALTANQSDLLATDDIFDIQLSDATRTWTVCKGTITVIDDVTGPYTS
jgi:hypothetical protein